MLRVLVCSGEFAIAPALAVPLRCPARDPRCGPLPDRRRPDGRAWRARSPCRRRVHRPHPALRRRHRLPARRGGQGSPAGPAPPRPTGAGPVRPRRSRERRGRAASSRPSTPGHALPGAQAMDMFPLTASADGHAHLTPWQKGMPSLIGRNRWTCPPQLAGDGPLGTLSIDDGQRGTCPLVIACSKGDAHWWIDATMLVAGCGRALGGAPLQRAEGRNHIRLYVLGHHPGGTNLTAQ